MKNFNKNFNKNLTTSKILTCHYKINFIIQYAFRLKKLKITKRPLQLVTNNIELATSTFNFGLVLG